MLIKKTDTDLTCLCFWFVLGLFGFQGSCIGHPITHCTNHVFLTAIFPFLCILCIVAFYDLHLPNVSRIVWPISWDPHKNSLCTVRDNVQSDAHYCKIQPGIGSCLWLRPDHCTSSRLLKEFNEFKSKWFSVRRDLHHYTLISSTGMFWLTALKNKGSQKKCSQWCRIRSIFW